MKLSAHLTIKNGIRKEQTLYEHCIQVAKYAAESVQSSNLYHTAYLAGLLHDLGKATSKFNAYLENAFLGEDVMRGSVNHTFAGVIYLLEKYHSKVDASNKWNCMASEMIAYAIGSHHGIFDCTDLDGNNGFMYRLLKEKKELCYEEAIQNYFEQVVSEAEIDKLFQKAVQEIQIFFEESQVSTGKQDEVFFQTGLVCRMILSAVIYGDRRDTSEFMNHISYPKKQNTDWKHQREYLEEKIAKYDSTTQLNQVRKGISEQCFDFAENPTGIYRLNVPTGAGKTLCTLRYALAHAERLHKKRIIFIIPLLSILDQNATVIREHIADKNLLLEHHSNVVKEKNLGEGLDPYELMAESWNVPIIISTMVQLLNILFTHQTSAIGRLQSLCDSVIVIDEIQSLPKKVTLMFNEAMNFFSKQCNATIVLSSATQPCLEEVQWPIRFAENADMVRLNQQQLEVFERAEMIDRTTPYGMDMDECANFCEDLLAVHSSLLVICNTKSEARQIFEKVQKVIDNEEVKLFHLSTSMCQKHRMNELTALQTALLDLQECLHKKEKGIKVVCIATQLVEAGVDFSFESVVRILAGVDNLAQAAGRCNRSNEYEQKGKVYLVNIKNERLKKLPEIMSAQSSTRKVLEILKHSDKPDYIGELASRKFYQYLFQEVRNELKYPVKEYGSEIFLAELLANKNAYYKGKDVILRYPFKTVGHKFRVFEDNTIDVIVPYKEGEQVIDELRGLQGNRFDFSKLRNLLQRAKAFTISIYQWQKEELEQYGLLEPCFDGRVFILNEKVYHSQYGLGKIEEQNVEDFII